MFPMMFGLLEERDSFTGYMGRLKARDAYRRASKADDDAQAELQERQPQPA